MFKLGPYTQRAENHWRDFLPEDYQKIPPAEREAFLPRMGAEIEARIGQRAKELAGEPEEPTGFQAQQALLNTL